MQEANPEEVNSAEENPVEANPEAASAGITVKLGPGLTEVYISEAFIYLYICLFIDHTCNHECG